MIYYSVMRNTEVALFTRNDAQKDGVVPVASHTSRVQVMHVYEAAAVALVVLSAHFRS